MKWLLLLLVTACGASTAQVAKARSAEYQAAADVVLDLAVQAAQTDYKIGDVDGPAHKFWTAPQFYTADGGRESPGAEGVTQIRPGSVLVQLLVEVHEEGSHVTVTVTPKTLQAIQGSPKPRELAPDDPYLPPWVLGRRDSLQLAIYERAKKYALAPP